MNPRPIRILAVYPGTGAWAIQGGNCIRGAQLAASDVNTAGGVLGGPLELEVLAVGEQPESARNSVERRLASTEVSTIVGAYLSNHTLAYLVAAEARGVPAITESFVSDVVERGYRFVFKTTPTAAAFSAAAFAHLRAMQVAKARPLPTVAIATADDASATQQYAAALAAADGLGFPVVFNTQFSGRSEMGTLAEMMATCSAGALLVNGPVTSLIELVRGLRQRAYAGLIVGLGGAGVLSQEFADRLGADVDGIFSTVAWNADISTLSRQASQHFQRRFDQRFMPVEAGTAYAAVRLAAAAMEVANSSEPEAVAQALRSIDLKDGVASLLPGRRISFDDRGLNAHCFPLLVQYQGGVPVTVEPAGTASRAAVF